MTRLSYPYAGRGRAGFTGTTRADDIPDRHRALAAELDFRDDVDAAQASASGVHVRLVDGVQDLPAWIHEKAGHVGIGLTLTNRDPYRPGAEGLRSRREAAGLSQLDVANELGVMFSIVGEIEQGVRALTPTRAAAIDRAIDARAAADGGGLD